MKLLERPEEDMTKDKNGKSVEICLSASFRGY